MFRLANPNTANSASQAAARSRQAMRALWLVVGIMTTALLGLVAIQLFWVVRSQKLQDAQFAMSVQSAMQEVVSQLEAEENRRALDDMLQTDDASAIDSELDHVFASYAYAGDPKHAGNPSLSPTAHEDDPQVQAWLQELPVDFPCTAIPRSKGTTKVFALRDPVMAQQWAHSGYRLYSYDGGDERGRTYFVVSRRLPAPFAAWEEDQFLQGGSSEETLAQATERSQLQLRKLRFKLENMRLALSELLYNTRPVPQRIDSLVLSKALTKAFAERGIHAPYKYRIIEGKAAEVAPVALTESERAAMPANGLFYATLFPNDLKPQNALLRLSFPGRKAFTYADVGGVLATSLAFIGLIVFGFTYSLRTIFRQKKLSEMKNDFINNMTHEFKTPIATISLASEAISEPRVQQNPEKLGRLVGIIREENRRLENQVERVLHMAEIDRGEVELALCELDMHEVLEGALTKIRLTVEKRGGTLDASLAASGTLVVADALHLTNIFHNLLDNANKYSPEPPQITVTTRNMVGAIWVEIADRGIGMTPEQQRRIFEKFYRVHTGNRHDVKGFGLGLAYVKSLVDAQGGTISVQSELGKGSTFRLSWPLSTEITPQENDILVTEQQEVINEHA